MKMYKIVSSLTTVSSPGQQQSFVSLALCKQHLSPQEFSWEECITNVGQIKLALSCYLLTTHFFVRLSANHQKATSGQKREGKCFTRKYYL